MRSGTVSAWAVAATVACVTAAMAATPNFRSDESRWYVRVSFTGSDNAQKFMHYVGATWDTKEQCEDALALSDGGNHWGKIDFPGLAEESMKEYGNVKNVKYFCGLGAWPNR
jgi:hypothetical protein